MTLVSAIIKSAYRESNVIASGAEPSAVQTDEALDRLNALIAAIMGHEVSDLLLDWPVGVDGLRDDQRWTAEQWAFVVSNVRLIANISQAQTLWLPPNPDDGARLALIDPHGLLAAHNYTLDANGRNIEGARTLTVSTNNVEYEWMYRAEKGDWVRSAILVAVDPMPFPMAFDDYFITKLAMRLNPRYGRSISEEGALMLSQMQTKLRARYFQTRSVPADLGAVHMTDGSGRFFRGRVPSRGRNGWMS